MGKGAGGGDESLTGASNFTRRSKNSRQSARRPRSRRPTALRGEGEGGATGPAPVVAAAVSSRGVSADADADAEEGTGAPPRCPSVWLRVLGRRPGVRALITRCMSLAGEEAHGTQQQAQRVAQKLADRSVCTGV